MTDITSTQTEPTTSADPEAALEHYMTEIRRLHAETEADHAVIERLKLETRALRADTRAILDRLSAAA